MKDYFKDSLFLHQKMRGKLKVESKLDILDQDDLSLFYTPGVAEPCKVIDKEPERARELTIKSNSVAVVSDGTAVLGLGNIGPLAAIPVMEGKAQLFKKFGDVDAFPICLDTQDADEIIETVRRIAPVFGGINLEDISAPRCFYIEEKLQDLGIPVFHDDQHGTAIVVLAGLINSARYLNKDIRDLRVVINGAGAAGTAIARLLRCVNNDPQVCIPVQEVLVCDRKGIIHNGRNDLNPQKQDLLTYTNHENRQGTLLDALDGADVFIGVSQGDILKPEDLKRMAEDPVIFALANPIPEIMPEVAYQGGAAIVATGRSDFPNQVNNVLVFPGIFRGALDAKATTITPKMKLAAAYSLADSVIKISRDRILPDPLNKRIAYRVATEVKRAALKEMELGSE